MSLLAASSLGACGSDSSNPPGMGSGGAPVTACNNNNVAEGTEPCDGTDIRMTTCQKLLMNMAAVGQVTCANCQFVPSGCSVPGGSGGATGTGGGTGVGTGGV
jgi:hypothetical protein